MIRISLPFGDLRALIVLADGRVLASGYDEHTCNFALLDPAQMQWEGPLLVPHWLALEQAVEASPGHVLVPGQPTVVVTTDPLRSEPVLPAREEHLSMAVALQSGEVLAAGGFWSPEGPTAEVRAYRDGQWTPRASLPGPRWSGVCARARSGHVVLTGQTREIPDRFSVDVYDPHADR